MRRIVIVGGGIGGLCAARAVALAGYEPVVLERAPAGTAIGAGLLLWPNAVHALDALGYGQAVRAVAAPARRTVFCDDAGHILSQVDVEALERRAGAPMLVVERPALHEVLAQGVAVRHDAVVNAVDERGVTLDGGERVDGDAVIGADGIGSMVREYVCPGARPLDSGYTVIRGIADHDIGRGHAFETWGRGELVGGVALPAGRSYWFYEAASPLIDGQDPLAAVGAGRLRESTPPTGAHVSKGILALRPPGTLNPHRPAQPDDAPQPRASLSWSDGAPAAPPRSAPPGAGRLTPPHATSRASRDVAPGPRSRPEAVARRSPSGCLP